MRFETELHDYDVVPLLNRLVEITGVTPWNKKFAALHLHLKQNELFHHYQIERHGIEIKLSQLLAEQEKKGVFPVAVQDQLQYSLYAFSASVVRIYDALSPAGKTRLRGMLLDGLKPDNNLMSLQHEVSTAVHLVSLGFDIELNDIENGSGVDFIARRDGAELEVECKMFTGDLGRQIHKRKVLVLYHHLRETMDRIYQSAKTGIIVRITIPARLTSQPGQLKDILDAVSKGILNGKAITRTSACQVEVLDFAVDSSPFQVDNPSDLIRTAVENFIHARLGRTNHNLMIMFSPGKKAVVALIESAKPDEVLKGIHRQLREASSGQFTRTRPGHLSVQFQELTVKQMEELAKDIASGVGKPVGLQIMTSDFLQNSNRAHIHSVAYRSHGAMSQLKDQPHVIMEQGIASYTRNPSNPYYNDLRLRPLR